MSKPRINRRTAEEEIDRLETFVRRMERRYETSSEDRASAVIRKRVKEIAEIAQ